MSPPLSPEQEQIALKTLTALGWTPHASRVPGGAIADALGVTQEQGEAILNGLINRRLIECRFEDAASNLLEKGHAVVNYRSKFFLVDRL